MINAYDGPKTEPWFDDFGDLEPLEKELEAAWEDFIAAVVGTKEEDVAREAMRIARANLAAHVEGREPVRQFVDEFVDEKIEPTFTFDDDFGDAEALVPPTAIESQVDGGHYKNQGVQPLEATFQNFGYAGLRASIYTKVGKYLTREKGTHRKDITKAIHCLQMQLEFFDRSTK
jgi:hypothetical protein